MSPDITFLTAVEALHAIQTGQLTSSELLEALLSRIEQVNPALNAIVTLDVKGARKRAQEADDACKAGQSWGPLHGLPITIKDSFETAGLRTTSGYPPLSDHVPAEDAPPVARLRQAGAIILGKTNLPTLASGIQTNNRLFGRTNNPWDVSRTPGGSSGGAAAAVAAGLSPLDLGSDIGGSLRIPAHFCGIYSLKTTGGGIEGKGHIASPEPYSVPHGWEPLLRLGSFGPLARSLPDLRLSLSIIARPDSPTLEPLSAPERVRPLSDLRLAWMDDFAGTPLDSDSRQMMAGLASKLSHAGIQVERAAPPGLDFDEAWFVSGLCLGAINTLFQPMMGRLQRRLTSPIMSSFGPRHPIMRGLFAGMALQGHAVKDALRRRDALSEQVESFLAERDAWICPVFPTPAFTHRSPNAPVEVDGAPMPQLLANLCHSILFNVTGHPAVTIPIGLTPGGLPVGVQVIGRRWGELALLDAAGQIDAVAGGYRKPPDLT